jgi:hypothetical protein
MEIISKNKLFNNIEHEKIVFHSGGSLLCFTHFESLLGNDDLSQSIADDFEWMNKFIIKSSWIRDKYLLILADKICCFVYLT